MGEHKHYVARARGGITVALGRQLKTWHGAEASVVCKSIDLHAGHGSGRPVLTVIGEKRWTAFEGRIDRDLGARPLGARGFKSRRNGVSPSTATI